MPLLIPAIRQQARQGTAWLRLHAAFPEAYSAPAGVSAEDGSGEVVAGLLNAEDKLPGRVCLAEVAPDPIHRPGAGEAGISRHYG